MPKKCLKGDSKLMAKCILRGSDLHKVAVLGDTVCNPFKDTSEPSLNSLIKLIAVISLDIAPLIK